MSVPLEPTKAEILVRSRENTSPQAAEEQKITLGSQITFEETQEQSFQAFVAQLEAEQATEQKNTSGSQTTLQPVQDFNLASVSPDAKSMQVERVKSSARALERSSQGFKADLPPAPLEPPPLPKTRALSTKNVTQLEAVDQRRNFHAREREAQAVPTRLSDALSAKVAENLSSRIESPFCAEDLKQQARFNQMSLFLEPKLVAELDAPFHWWRAVNLLEPIRGALGTAYRPLLVILSLASSVGRSLEDLERLSQSLGSAAPDSSLERRDSVFFAALWEVATVTGITPDYLRKVLTRHSGKLRRILHHHDWKTETTFTGDKQVLIAGCLFRVRWPSSGEQYSPDVLRGGKTKTVYKALINRKAVYRDLDADVYDGHTQKKYRSEGKVSTNPLGRVKNVTSSDALPEGFALELLTYCMGRIRGLTGSTVSDVQRFGSEIERINALVTLLESPLERGHNKLENRVRAVATLLCQTLEGGSERSYKGWLEVGWTLYRTGKVSWLLQAVWDVLIRASDLGSIRSKGALVRHMLNARGYAELRMPFETEQQAA